MARSRVLPLSARSANAAGGGIAPSRRPPADHDRRAYHLPSLAGGAVRDRGIAGDHRQSLLSESLTQQEVAHFAYPFGSMLACAEREAAWSLQAAFGPQRPPGPGACSLGMRRSYALPREGVQWHDDEASLACKSIGAPLPARSQARAAVARRWRRWRCHEERRAAAKAIGPSGSDPATRAAAAGTAHVVEAMVARRLRSDLGARDAGGGRIDIAGTSRTDDGKTADSARRPRPRPRRRRAPVVDEHREIGRQPVREPRRPSIPADAGAADRGRRCPGAFGGLLGSVRDSTAHLQAGAADQAAWTSTSFTPATWTESCTAALPAG